MQIKHITMTGVDNTTSPEQLIEVARLHPDVEFGVLFSEKSEDTPRFPGYYWTQDFLPKAHAAGLKLSAHICGRWVRDMVGKGLPGWFDDRKDFVPFFQRVQFNFHGKAHEISDEFFKLLQAYPEKEFIFQFDGVNDDILRRFEEYGLENAVALFDLSGGAGIVPDAWPAPVGKLSGYAGGLGPDNLAAELKRIEEAAGDADIWLDMETRIRSDQDRVFSIPLVMAALEAVELYRNPPAAEEPEEGSSEAATA